MVIPTEIYAFAMQTGLRSALFQTGGAFLLAHKLLK
jgi:hypothetical protein